MFIPFMIFPLVSMNRFHSGLFYNDDDDDDDYDDDDDD